MDNQKDWQKEKNEMLFEIVVMMLNFENKDTSQYFDSSATIECVMSDGNKINKKVVGGNVFQVKQQHATFMLSREYAMP